MIKKALKIVYHAVVIGALLGLFTGTINNNEAINNSFDYLQNQISLINKNVNQLVDNDIYLITNVQDLARKNEQSKEDVNKFLSQFKGPDLNFIINGSVFVNDFMGMGSGTIIKTTKRCTYVLTCAHVVAKFKEFQDKGYMITGALGYNKTGRNNDITGMVLYPYEILKYDEEVDLALLRIFEVDKNLNVIKIAVNEPVKGDLIFSVGNPLGMMRTLSKGILANKVEGYYITDNTITFGNSGGGLYNGSGELIGVPARVPGYSVEQKKDNEVTVLGVIPESGLGESIDLQTIKEFLRKTSVTEDEESLTFVK